jgi:pSer/pThr/pTyr-binding forkhead associated (FHA) protein
MDLGSTNGTLLNGAQLVPNQRYALQEDDVVTIAPFRISYIVEQRTLKTIVETSGNKASAFETPWRVPTGTEEHKSISEGDKNEAVAVMEATPPPPPAQESKHVSPEVAPPVPPPVAASEMKPVPVSAAITAAPAKSSMGDYLWMGIGILVFLAALGLIAFVLMME